MLDAFVTSYEWIKVPSHMQLEGNERADALAELGRKSSLLYSRAGRQPRVLLTPVAAPLPGDPRQSPPVDLACAIQFSIEMTPMVCEADLSVAQVTPAPRGGGGHMYHQCPAQNIGREANIVTLPVAVLRNLYRRACDMLRSAAWKFSKTLGKMLGSFGSQIGSQNATDIGRNVPWTSQPTVPGELGRNF